MANQDYDVIVAGAGLAGCSASIIAARGGLKVLLLEKSDIPGKMNLTGGRLYTHALKKLLPDSIASAPFQRRVVNERISILTETAASTLEYFHEPAGSETGESYTVLRKSLDPWLFEEAKNSGATTLLSQDVKSLVKEGDNIVGVRTKADEFRGRVVILADGASSLLGQSLGLVKQPDPINYAIGAKEVIRLGEEVINERFNCLGEDGAAWLFLGYPTRGHMGGGFLYTNRDSISVGMVLGQKESKESGVSILAMLNEFKNHPLIRPLLKDGEVISKGGHLIAEGGYDAIPEIAANGVLIAGDAASFCLNLGYTVRGMDLAILSGIAAGNTVIRAAQADNFSSNFLWSYYDELEKENVLPEMKLYKNLPEFLHNKRIFETYPQLVNNFIGDMFSIDGKSEPAWKKISRYMHKAGFLNIMKDIWTGIKSF